MKCGDLFSECLNAEGADSEKHMLASELSKKRQHMDKVCVDVSYAW